MLRLLPIKPHIRIMHHRHLIVTNMQQVTNIILCYLLRVIRLHIHLLTRLLPQLLRLHHIMQVIHLQVDRILQLHQHLRVGVITIIILLEAIHQLPQCKQHSLQVILLLLQPIQLMPH